MEHIEEIYNLIEKGHTRIKSGQLADIRRSRLEAPGELPGRV